MAETSKNKIYYNDNEDSIADVLEDMKKLAESTDNAIEKAKYNDTELKNKNTAQDEEIEQLKEKDTTQDSLIEELQTKVVNLEAENTSLKNQIPSGEATGNPIHLTDSSDLECEIVPISGTEQETREGYNLAKTDDMIVSAGSCTLKINIPSGDYTLAFYKSRISGVTISNVYLFEFKYIKYYDSNDNLLNTLTNSSAPKLESGTVQIVRNFTAPSETSYISIEFSNDNGDYNLNTLVSKVMLLKGTYTADTLPPYEQYGAMPSPDYPSEVVTVGQNVNIIDYTKLTSFEHYDLTVTQIANGIRVTCNTTTPHINSKYMLINLEKYKGKNLTISANIKSSSSNRGIVLLAFCDSNGGNRSDNTYTEETTDGKVSLTKAIPETLTDNTSYLCLVLYGRRSVYDDTQVGEYVDYTEIKLVEGTEVGGYSPYGQGSVEISVDNGLETTDTNYQSYTKVLPIQKEFVKINGVEDTFIKVDGKWYEKHNIAKKVFDGTETLTYVAKTGDRYAYKFILENKIIGIHTKEYLSNMYKQKTEPNWSSDGLISVSNTLRDTYLFVYNLPTVQDLKTWLQEQFNAGTPLIVYYILETPELIECTAEQESILNSFYTYKGITNISVDGIATLKVNYKKDLETIINNLSATSVAE